MRFVLPTLFLLTVPLFGQQPAVNTDQLDQELNREAGLEMVFRNPLPPLAKLTFKEVETTEAKGRKLVRYSIGASGLAKPGPYILMLWDIETNAPVIAFQGLKVDTNGTLRCVEKSKDCPGGGPNNQLVLGFTGMVGQPRRIVLAGTDKKPLAMGEVVPFPASGSDQDCTIEAVLMRPNGSAVYVIGRGFQPGETVKLESSSYGESSNDDKTANGIGVVTTMLLPFIKGHDEGKSTITMTGSKCHPTTTINWGAYHEEPADPVQAKDPAQNP
jgi:hypothetical protein